MKLLKIEKWWLIVGIALYAIYNIPGIPAYGDLKGAVIWNVASVILIWAANYGFNAKVSKVYRPRKTTEEFLKENAALDRARAEQEAAEEAELLKARGKK